MNIKGIGILLILLLGAEKRFVMANAVPDMRESVSVSGDSLLPRERMTPVRLYSFRDTLLPVFVRPTSVVNRTNAVYLPDSLIRESLVYEYTKIKDFANRSKFTRELYKMVFVSPKRGQVNVMRTQNSEERFKAFRGKEIREVSVKVLPPYGSSIYDTTYYEEDISWVKMLANKTHMSTAERVIRKQLTFKAGTPLNPFELVQNEILLRDLDYINDVTITVAKEVSDTNLVNVLVICKDQLSWGGSVESNFLNSFGLGVDNKNFMKLGHVVNYEISYRGTKEKKWGNILEYKVNSVWGSHINIRDKQSDGC